MVNVVLQDLLVDKIRSLLDGFTLKNAWGQEAAVRVYPQFVPAAESGGVINQFPFLRVILVDGVEADAEGPQQCRVVFAVGTYGPDEGGYQDLCHIMQTIYAYLKSSRVFDDRFELVYPIKWRLKVNDAYPNFFGELETNWVIGKITAVDDLI